jgi:fructokinase
MIDLVCLGEFLIDMFPAEVGKRLAEVSAFYPKPGGAPANVAVAASRLGARSAFIGKVGDDAFGHALAGVLKAEGVETRGLVFDSQVRTTLAFIAMPDENSAEFMFYRNPGADLCLRAGELDRDLLKSAKAFHCGSLSLVDEPARTAHHTAAALARQSGALISFDVNYRPSLWKDQGEAFGQIRTMVEQADLLKVNERELELLTGSSDVPSAASGLLERGPELIAVTLGPGGSYFCTRQACGFIPAFPVDTVDAVGCGDAFIAGLLCRLIQGSSWREKLEAPALKDAFRFANAVGAVTALQRGVIPALPTAERIEAFLDEHFPGRRAV